MEDKGVLSKLSKLLGGKKEEPPTTPTTQSEKPSMPSAAEDRQRRMEEIRKQRGKAFVGHAIDQATGKQAVTQIKDTRPEAIKPSVEKIGVEQTLGQAAEKQESMSPKGTPGERFRRLTQTETPQTPPVSPVKQAEKPIETVTESPKPTLSERKTQELDAERLEKSLQEPKSEWGKAEPATPQEPAKESDSAPPFPPGTFPGVDKWQPGKGAIKGEMLEEVKEKVKEMPKYPSSESEQEVEKDKPMYTPQEEFKKAA